MGLKCPNVLKKSGDLKSVEIVEEAVYVAKGSKWL